MDFSTKDKDNDKNRHGNCAVAYKGAWWFKACFACHLNGQYFKEYNINVIYAGINWQGFRGFGYSLRFAEMKIRPSYM